MKTYATDARPFPDLTQPPARRLRPELPAVSAAHDFLVPNPRPDLTRAPALAAPAAREERRRFIEPDSIFWCPVSHDGDAA